MHSNCTVTFKEQGSHNNIHRLQLWQLWVNVYKNHVKKSVVEDTQYYWTTKIIVLNVAVLFNIWESNPRCLFWVMKFYVNKMEHDIETVYTILFKKL